MSQGSIVFSSPGLSESQCHGFNYEVRDVEDTPEENRMWALHAKLTKLRDKFLAQIRFGNSRYCADQKQIAVMKLRSMFAEYQEEMLELSMDSSLSMLEMVEELLEDIRHLIAVNADQPMWK